MKERMRDYWRLLRGENLLFIAVLMWVMTYWVARSVLIGQGIIEVIPWWLWLLMTTGTVFIAAGGYVINDYFDVKIDRINRPDHLVITQSVSKASAMRLFYVLTGLGVVFGLVSAWLVRSSSVAIIYAFVPGLLWFYSASYKRILIVGNLIVAFVSGLVPLLVALIQMAWVRLLYGDDMLRFVPIGQELYAWLGGFALFAFLCTWAREMVKDLQDQNGDRELECHTMPIVWGDIATKSVATIVLLAVVGLVAWLHWGHVMPFATDWHSPATRYIVFGMYVPIACELVLLWSAKIPSDYRSAQGLMKFIMFLGSMFSFVVNGV